MKLDTNFILRILYFLAWLIFVGLSIEAGGFITNTVGTAFLEPEVAGRLWKQVDLSSLYNYDRGYFYLVSVHMCVAAVLKAILFYCIIHAIHGKNINPAQPFSPAMGRLLFRLSYLSIFIGIVSLSGIRYSEWLATKGVTMPEARFMKLGGADVWFFMGIIIFVIGQLFKKGIEMQAEQDLTV
jgi:hypothetical protein